MGFQKANITINHEASRKFQSILYISLSSGRSISLISDPDGSEIGTFLESTNINTTALNIYNSLIRDLSVTNVFGPVEVAYNGTNEIDLSVLDENVTSISVSGTGELAGNVSQSSSTVEVSDVYETSGKVNVRSPYMLEVTDESGSSTIDSAALDIYIYDTSRYSSRPSEPTYKVVSTAPQSDSTSIYFNISEYAKDFFQRNQIGLDESTNIQYIDVFPSVVINGVEYTNEPKFFRGFYGYGYMEEGTNPQNLSGVMMSNDTIYSYGDSIAHIPVDSAIVNNLAFLDENNVQIGNQAISYSGSSTSEIVYVPTSGASPNTIDQYFKSLESNEDFYYEENDCFYQFFKDYEIQGAVKAVASTEFVDSDGDLVQRAEVIKIKTIEECKYKPIRVKFVNKFGAYQNLWFFKNSSLSMTTDSESFRRNTFNYTDGVVGESAGTYNQYRHQYKNLFKEGKEKLTINSGFYPESHNEVFRQLMLSEDVWVDYNNEMLPVNISNSDIKFKTSVTDKMINYTVELDFAFDKIQNIT